MLNELHEMEIDYMNLYLISRGRAYLGMLGQRPPRFHCR
jgi:hypothetical protein